MFDFRLSQKEITLLSQICRGSRTLEELSEEISRSYSRTSELVTRLEKKGFIIKSNKLKKTIKKAKNEHAQKFCNLTTTFPHIDWEHMLSNSKAEILTQICHEPTDVAHLSKITKKTRKTIRNNLEGPMEIGIVEKQGDLKVTERFDPCCSFLQSWRYYYALSLLDEIAPNSTIVLQDGLEFIIESDSRIKSTGFVETGPSYLSDIDEQLVYTANTYLYTKRKIGLEEHLKYSLKVTSDQRIYDAVKRVAEEKNISMEDLS